MSYIRNCCKCHKDITEKIYLVAEGRTWHTSCLTCEKCCVSLAITGNSYYLKDGIMLCKTDYYKLFSCAACDGNIDQGSYAHKISCSSMFYNNKKILYYHPSCLKCRQCENFLKKGDKYTLKADNSGIFCLKCCAPPDYIQDQSLPVPRKRNRQSNASVKLKQEKLQNQNQSQFNQM